MKEIIEDQHLTDLIKEKQSLEEETKEEVEEILNEEELRKLL